MSQAGSATTSPLYSGLETSGMLTVHCSLCLQPNAAYAPLVKQLPPRQVTVAIEDSSNKRVHFQGCTILQLDPIGKFGERTHTVMPTILTIGGPCYYSHADKKDFEILMRTRATSRQMGLPPNGDMDWPDHRAFVSCPCCGATATPSNNKNEEYMLLFYPLMQAGPRGLGMRMICRLTCLDCFESLVDGLTISAKRDSTPDAPFQVSVLDAVEDQGPITWLERGVGMGSCDGKTLSAFSLCEAWELTGAWQVLQDSFAETVQQAMSGAGRNVEVRNAQTEPRNKMDEYYEGKEGHWVMRSSSKTGRTCSGPGCAKVHRSIPQGGGKKIRLHFCLGCRDTLYCNADCQSNHWEEHKPYCKAKQREIKKAEKERIAREEAEEKARVDAVAASFAPMNLLNPQQGGSGKRNNKKKGGKKKKKGKK